MTIADWISAELARDGLRLAEPTDRDAWHEETSAGAVLVTDAEIPATDDLIAYAQAWDAAALHTRLAAPAPRPAPLTAAMLYDIWGDCDGLKRAAAVLRALPAPELERLAVGYWVLLRKKRHAVPLRRVRIAFELALLWNA